MRPDSVGLGGFDSHAFPPRALVAVTIAVLCAALSLAVPFAAAAAQTPSVVRLTPPISPKRAFLSSAILPGLGQASLDRSTGLLFVTVEAIALTMYSKSRGDLDVARRFRRDSTPLTYVIDPSTGLPDIDPETELPRVATWSSTGRFSKYLIRARKTHVEDWVALLIFNHLFAGIDAFVAAQLWELPGQVQLRAHSRTVTVRATVPW